MAVKVTLEHPKVTEVYKSGIFNKVDSFPKLISAINKHALEVYPLGENEEDDDDIKNSRNDLKGDFFEVFTEFLLNVTAHDNRIGFSDIHHNIDDLGVDFVAKGYDGKNAVVQAKFRANIKQPLTYRELSTFGNDALARYGIRSEAQAELTRKELRDADCPEKYVEVIKSTMHNMLVVATTLEAYYHWETVNRGSQFLGYNEIRQLTNNMPNFWQDFRKALEVSAIPPKPRNRKKLWPSQKKVKKAVKKFLQKGSGRGQVIVGTGGGKTINEAEAIADSIRLNGSLIHVVLTPRIALTQQVLREFHDYKPNDISWDLECVCSGEDEKLEFYKEDGDLPNIVDPTCNQERINDWVDSAIRNKKPLVMFATYHSAKKIRRATLKHDVDSSVTICDEAHNLVGEFKKILDETSDTFIPTSQWLFFTATRKVDYSGNGRGMNNEKLFGKIIAKIIPKELMEQGRIVPPRIHIVYYDPGKYIDDYSDEHVLDNIAMIIEGIKEHKRLNPEMARVIVFCGNARTEPKDYMSNRFIKDAFPEFYMAAVTSEYTYERKPGEMSRSASTRKNVFQQFKDHDFSIIFHYDVLSEGIDFPGATGKLPLRSLNNIKIVQGAGRTVRLDLEDRKKLSQGEIQVGNPTGWKKPNGWVIVPVISKNNNDDADRLMDIIRSLRDEGFDIDVDMINGVLINPNGGEEDDFLNPKNLEEKSVVDMWSKDELDKVIQEIRHEIEPKSKATVKPRARLKCDTLNKLRNSC